MSKQTFTVQRIAKFECPAGKQQAIYWDAKTPGLGLRVTAKGAKSYIFEARLHGKSIRLTIGDPLTWTITKAQAEATNYKYLTDKGIDPREVAAEQKAKAEAKRLDAQRKAMTVGELWDVYIEARTPKWGTRHLQNHKALAHAGGKIRTRGLRPNEAKTTIPGPLHPLLALRLADLDANAVRTWLEKEVAIRPTWAGQAYRALRAFLTWAASKEDFISIIPPNVCSKQTVRDVLPKSKPKNDVLQKEQLKPWFAAVKSIGNPVISSYLQVLLLTGARRDELASLKWADVDFRWQSITIRDKVEGERTIPLTPYVFALLMGLKNLNEKRPEVKSLHKKDVAWQPSPWVFPSPKAKSGRLQEPRIQHVKACCTAKIDGLTLHGLRRSFKSLSEWLEMPVGIVAQVMGHKPSATAEKHYTVRPLDLLRKWHSKYEDWILEEAGIEFHRMDLAAAA